MHKASDLELFLTQWTIKFANELGITSDQIEIRTGDIIMIDGLLVGTLAHPIIQCPGGQIIGKGKRMCICYDTKEIKNQIMKTHEIDYFGALSSVIFAIRLWVKLEGKTNIVDSALISRCIASSTSMFNPGGILDEFA